VRYSNRRSLRRSRRTAKPTGGIQSVDGSDLESLICDADLEEMMKRSALDSDMNPDSDSDRAADDDTITKGARAPVVTSPTGPVSRANHERPVLQDSHEVQRPVEQGGGGSGWDMAGQERFPDDSDYSDDDSLQGAAVSILEGIFSTKINLS
jgi:hypothetical protein